RYFVDVPPLGSSLCQTRYALVSTFPCDPYNRSGPVKCALAGARKPGSAGTYTVLASLIPSRNDPITSALAAAPIKMAICWYFGVAPSRKPVFKSCEVDPPFDAATQTIPPTDNAVT